MKQLGSSPMALVLVIRHGEITSALANSMRALGEMAKHPWERMVIVIAGGNPDQNDAHRTRARQEVPESLRSNCDVYAPQELDAVLERSMSVALAQYLGDTLSIKILRRRHEVLLWWRSDWLDLVIAGTTIAAALPMIRWWHPSEPPPEVWPDARRAAANLSLDQSVNASALSELVGTSDSMQHLRDRLKMVASWTTPILLEGETGTGKELIASVVHRLSKRKGRLVPVNAALMNPLRTEDDLCGHKAGAFTGASTDRKGRIRESQDGTFFLDELDSIPSDIESMLLRAFNHALEGYLEVTPLGSEREEKVNTRLITAVHSIAKARTKLRDDLYNRVAGITIRIPPLRERGDDLIEIFEGTLKMLNDVLGSGPTGIHPDARAGLLHHSWPGNVRELKRVANVAFHTARHERKKVIELRHVREELVDLRPSDEECTKNLRHAVRALVEKRIAQAKEGSDSLDARAAISLGFRNKQEIDRYIAVINNQAERSRSPK